MDSPVRDLFYNLGEKIVGYLPSLFAGLVLLGIGWLLAWIAKRVVVQICVILRLDRLLRRLRWGESFAKADVRYTLFNSAGNLVFVVVFLIFLNAALASMQLTVLSNLIERGVLFIPKFVIALLIIGLGWIIAGWVSRTIQRALTKEDIPRATLIARFTRSVLLLFFAAMALTELDIAREIVIIGFTTIIITLGVLTVVVTARGGKSLVDKLLRSLEED